MKKITYRQTLEDISVITTTDRMSLCSCLVAIEQTLLRQEVGSGVLANNGVQE